MKKLICRLALLCLALVSTLPALAEGSDAHTVTERTMPFYFYTTDNAAPFSVYFIDNSDVPYLSLADWPLLMDGSSEDAETGEEKGLEDHMNLMNYDELEGLDEEELEQHADLLAQQAQASAPDYTFSLEGNVGRLTRPDRY